MYLYGKFSPPGFSVSALQGTKPFIGFMSQSKNIYFLCQTGYNFLLFQFFVSQLSIASLYLFKLNDKLLTIDCNCFTYADQVSEFLVMGYYMQHYDTELDTIYGLTSLRPKMFALKVPQKVYCSNTSPRPLSLLEIPLYVQEKN